MGRGCFFFFFQSGGKKSNMKHTKFKQMFTFVYKRVTRLNYGEACQLLDHASDISKPCAFAGDTTSKTRSIQELDWEPEIRNSLNFPDHI